MLLIRKLLNAAILSMILFGVLLRFAFLFIAFEYDELFTVITVDPTLSLGWIVQHWLLIDVHPPLYNILLYFYNTVYYTHWEWWVRIPSLVCSLLSIWVAWRLFPRYLGRSTRWLFVGLFVCSFQLMSFAPLARSYSLLVLLALLHMFVSLDIWRSIFHHDEIPFQKWLCWSILGTLLGYTHYFGVAVFCANAIMLGAGLVGNKRPWRTFLICFSISFGLICLWMIPNFLSNWQQKRFAGNWWASGYWWTAGIYELPQFVFGNYFIYMVVGLLCLGTLLYDAKKLFRKEVVPLLKERIFLFGVISIVVLTILLMSVKIYLLVPRFFFVLFPYVYLFVALSLARWLRKSIIPTLILLGICAWNVYTFEGFAMYRYINMPDNAKQYSLYFLQQHGGKDLFVVVLDGLPVPAMQAMFSYYIQKYYGRKDVAVTVLNPFSSQEIEELIHKNPQAIIWLPNCDHEKINRLQKERGLSFARKLDIGYHCELTLLSAEPTFQNNPI